MLKIERQDKILNLLKEKESVLVTELSSLFNCSDETIRRDLKELDSSNLLTKTHGGAFINEKHDKSYPSNIRKELFSKEKISMSKEAVKQIKDNDFIFLDSSTTCLQLFKEIINNKLTITVATNSISIALLCSEISNDIDLILLGGIIRKKNSSTTGYEALCQLNNYMADKCFISPPKVSLKTGMTDNNINEAKVRESMVKRSSQNILLADNTKFKGDANYFIDGLENINIIISNHDFNNDWVEFSKNNGNIKLIKTHSDFDN